MAEGPFRLESNLLGPLPVINHFLDRLGVTQRLMRWLPGGDASVRLAPAQALGVALRHLCLGREPLYALAEWARRYDARLLGLAAAQQDLLNDDRLGRALEQLFAADRASLLTELIVAMLESFHIDCSQLHNDSTTITFAGGYQQANGQPRRAGRHR